MSPEQILGDKLDFRSDLFSLGIVLYQMVTGQKPFVEDDSFTVMQKIRLDRYVAPRKLNPQVPRQLEHIMARCMEKMPANRYASTQALIDDLVEFLATCVPINHSARLVMFLREVSVISDAEADEILEAAGSRGAKKRVNDRSLVRHVALAMTTMLVAIGVSGGLIQTVGGQLRTQSSDERGNETVLSQEHAGFLQVVVDPWAEVFVDGRLLTVTPTAERFMLSPGRHFVKLVHPQYQPVTKEIRIERGKLSRLKVALTSPLKPGSVKP